ncbi:MAG TPA: DUF1697 domain-containing protein [Hyphomicrobiaceae bacterium]|nr:DUF1697 domain-containing protein [Hyphomicrobiaceae bacterium]
MISHIALLRGVNVGGNMLKMERLRAVFAELGFAGALTYLQSGNVLFTAEAPAADLAGRIAQAVSAETRLPVSVILRTPAQWRRLIAANPFAREAETAPKTVHVTFLASAPAPAGLAAIGKLNEGTDRWHAAGSEIYLHCPNGYGRSKLVNTALERALGLRATTRNWSTVMALREMAES